MAPDGARLGYVLPGRGIYLDHDLKSLGINRPIPGVFERSRFHRLMDRLNDERGAITTYDGIVSGRANGKGEDIVIAKSSITTGAWSDRLTNPTGSDKKYLIAVGWGCSSAHNFAILVDMHQQSGIYRATATT